MRTRPGWSGSLPATGWSSSGPNRSASATCSARVMSWSRTKRTLYCSSNALSSAKSPASRDAAARLTRRSSAPIVAVSGTTSIECDPAVSEGKRSCSIASRREGMGISCSVRWCGGPAEDGSGTGRLQAEDGGPDAAAGFQVAVSRDGVVEGVALVDLDGDPAGGDVVEELTGQRGALPVVGDVVGQGGAGDEQRSLDRQLHRVDRRDGSGRRPEAHEQPAPAQRVQ